MRDVFFTSAALFVLLASGASAQTSFSQAAITRADLQGDWSQKVRCRGHASVDFDHQLRIYVDQRGLRFKGNAPVKSAQYASGRDARYYYGAVQVSGDIVTLKVSPRYYRDLPDVMDMGEGVVAQDASYQLTQDGDLVALGVNACKTTPLKRAALARQR
ncbi:hypothetical protein CA606_19080 [Caulobacter vibrioides]|uniref:Uncharacterized protein n=1 Tax=Caulobacter vibrioides TaxID=155892 RepID=A0A290MQK6_CAUVI|nr:hypothetical protein [Caulobacter vibrioides]ATC34270.1 hypothetical protein CA606_19080 [Caulobacter vibrioides]